MDVLFIAIALLVLFRYLYLLRTRSTSSIRLTSPSTYADTTNTNTNTNVPSCAILVAAYLQNELTVIEQSIETFLKVKGVEKIIVVWNGTLADEDLGILDRMQKMGSKGKINIKIIHVADSQSKAQNLNHVLPEIQKE